MDSIGKGSLFSVNFDGKASVTRLDMQAMTTMYDFFHHEDLHISIAQKNLSKSTLHGGVELNWGGLIALRLSAEENHALVLKSAEAATWRTLFGFCPVKRIAEEVEEKDEEDGDDKDATTTTATTTVKKKNTQKDKPSARKSQKWVDFEIQEFGTGDFYMVFENGRGELKYMPHQYNVYTKNKKENKRNKSSLDHLTSNGAKSVSTDDIKFPKNYYVYVWPMLRPSLHNGLLKTPASKLLKIYSTIKHLEKNMLINDTNRAMPPVVTKRDLVKQTYDDLTEDQKYGDVDVTGGGNDPLEEQTYKRNLSAEQRMKQKSRQFRQMGLTSQRNQLLTYNTTDGCWNFQYLRHPLDQENILNLDEGVQLDHIQDTNTTPDYLQLKRDYEALVERTFGVDHSSQSGSGASRLKANAEQNREMLKTLVMDERDAIVSFYATVYEFVHRNKENVRIAEMQRYLDEERETLVWRQSIDGDAPETLHRIKELDTQIKMMSKIASSKFRIELHFPKNPFITSVDKDTTKLLLEQKVLTPLEEINMLRHLGGFEALPRDHEIVIERERMRELYNVQAEEELMISPLEQAQAQLNSGTSAAPKKRKSGDVSQSTVKKDKDKDGKKKPKK